MKASFDGGDSGYVETAFDLRPPVHFFCCIIG